MSKLKQCVKSLTVLHPACTGTEMQLASAQVLVRDAGINFTLCRNAQVCCLATTCMYECFSCLYLCDSEEKVWDNYWEDGGKLGC